MIALGICLALMLGLSLLMAAWWWIMAVPFVYFLWRGRKVGISAGVGAGSAGILWLGSCLWMWIMGGADLIAPRVAQALGADSPVFLLVLAVALASLAGGVAGAAGASIRIAAVERTS